MLSLSSDTPCTQLAGNSASEAAQQLSRINTVSRIDKTAAANPSHRPREHAMGVHALRWITPARGYDGLRVAADRLELRVRFDFEQR